MKRLCIPGTELTVSRLSFGTASLHHLRTSFKRQRLLESAYEHGFTHFDTSPYYGFGLCEWELGRFLKAAHRTATVASKFGLYPPGSLSHSTASVWMRKGLGKLLPALSAPHTDWSLAEAQKSLNRTLHALGRDCVDILFLHEPEIAAIDADAMLEWLERQKESGKLRYWGLAGQLKRFESWARDTHPLGPILQVQDDPQPDGTLPLAAIGREVQFTYGCLSSLERPLTEDSVSEALDAALKRNSLGSLIVSTRHVAHLSTLAQRAH